MEGLSVNDLVVLVKQGQTVEHILSEEPAFRIKAYGFHSKETYELNIHRIGNLTLLTRAENSICSNNTVETKVNEQKMYRSSSYHMTRAIAAEGVQRVPSFSKDNIDTRSGQLNWPHSVCQAGPYGSQEFLNATVQNGTKLCQNAQTKPPSMTFSPFYCKN